MSTAPIVILPSMHLSKAVDAINTNFISSATAITEVRTEVVTVAQEAAVAAIPTLTAGRGILIEPSADGTAINISCTLAAVSFAVFAQCYNLFSGVAPGILTEDNSGAAWVQGSPGTFRDALYYSSESFASIPSPDSPEEITGIPSSESFTEPGTFFITP